MKWSFSHKKKEITCSNMKNLGSDQPLRSVDILREQSPLL